MKKIVIILITIIFILALLFIGVYVYSGNQIGYYEGQQISSLGKPICLFGLKAISYEIVDGSNCVFANCLCYICAKCGNGICGKGENWCNCPEDCKPPKVESDWKIINSPVYGFEMSYPVATDKWGRLIPIRDSLDYGFVTIPLEDFKDITRTINIDIVEASTFNGSCDYNFNGRATEQFLSNGISFTKGDIDFLYAPSKEYSSYGDEYCIAKNQYVYRIKTSWTFSSKNPQLRSDFENDSIINKVISTFKFIK